MSDILKYIIYSRKSQENRDRQVLSIESQLVELREFAARNGLKVVKEFQESQSAFKPGRPVFAGVMEMLETGLANAVLTWKPDRIARCAVDGGRFIQAMDDGHIQELRTPYEMFRREDNRMMLYIHFGMSNDYSRQISANVKRGNREKYRRGEFLGRAPLGYLNAKVGDSRNIVIDPAKGILMRRLFEEFASGKYSVQGITKEASEWGLLSVNGGQLAKSGMHTILRCSAYYGAFQHGGELHEGKYQALITKETFDKVQEVLRDHQKPRKKIWKHDLVGLMKCQGCGCAITAETKTKHYQRTHRDVSYTYYRCTRRRGKCDEPGVTAERMEQMIRDYLDKIVIDQETWELGVKLLRAKYAAQLNTFEQMRDGWQREYNQLEKKLASLLDMRLSGEIGSDEYGMAKKGLLETRIDLKQKLDDENDGSLQWLERAEDFFDTALRARQVFDRGMGEEKRNLIRSVGWNLFLGDGKLEFSFKQPFDILLKPEARQDLQG